jgi:hypothetical protein
MLDKKVIVELIDKLAPFNNQWRVCNDPIKKIELMWEIGKEIDFVVKKYNYGFDKLLRTLYDPHGQKMSYITRDLGSYSHRIYLYFKNKDEIKKKLYGLKHYTLFREAFPLLTNVKYKLSEKDRDSIFQQIVSVTSQAEANKIFLNLKKQKQLIRPIKNTRTTKSMQYSDQKVWLNTISKKIIDYYKSNIDFDSENFIKINLTKEFLKDLSDILISIAFNTSLKNDKIDSNEDNLLKLKIISNSNTEDKARFKKWVLDTNSIIKIIELINGLLKPENYKFIRQNFIK